jgi:hypothetical protein
MTQEERVLNEEDLYETYDAMLDECYPRFMDSYDASQVLKEIDPTAYSCGFSDWLFGQIDDDLIHEGENDLYHEGSKENCDLCEEKEED